MSHNNKKSNTETIIYSVIGAGIVCSFIPAYIPYCIFGAGLIRSVYGIADIISKSDYINSQYVSKENVKYFENK